MAEFKLRAQVPTERQEHLALMDWVRLQPAIRDVFIHIANEYDGGAIKGHVRRILGVRKGVSDFLLPLPRGGFASLWIELKRREGGSERVEQREWIERMRKEGHAAYFCYGCDDAIGVIKAYLGGHAIVRD